MGHTFQASGFVIINGCMIWGYGTTEEAAWADFRKGMDSVGIEVLSDNFANQDAAVFWAWSDEADRTSMSDAFVHECACVCQPATAGLLTAVESQGGALRWTYHGGIACTCAEEDAAEESDEEATEWAAHFSARTT